MKTTKKQLKKLAKRELNKQDKAWALEVKARDNFQCVYCGAKNKRLNAHHIISRTNESLRHNINNGITLCPNHHRFSFDMSAHQNPFMFYIWFSENRQLQYNNLLTAIEKYIEDEK